MSENPNKHRHQGCDGLAFCSRIIFFGGESIHCLVVSSLKRFLSIYSLPNLSKVVSLIEGDTRHRRETEKKKTRKRRPFLFSKQIITKNDVETFDGSLLALKREFNSRFCFALIA